LGCLVDQGTGGRAPGFARALALLPRTRPCHDRDRKRGQSHSSVCRAGGFGRQRGNTQAARAAVQQALLAFEEIAKAEKSAEYGKWKDWYGGDWLTGIPRTRELVQIFGKRLEDPRSPMPPPVFWTGWEAYYHIMHYEGERTASVD